MVGCWVSTTEQRLADGLGNPRAAKKAFLMVLPTVDNLVPMMGVQWDTLWVARWAVSWAINWVHQKAEKLVHW
jgi:hypothetical protein